MHILSLRKALTYRGLHLLAQEVQCGVQALPFKSTRYSVDSIRTATFYKYKSLHSYFQSACIFSCKSFQFQLLHVITCDWLLFMF